MQRDDPTGHRPGGPAPGGPGAGPDTVLAALAHRLRARSERQQLLTERLRSGELRPGALADLAELAAAARRGVRDGDHILVMAGAAEPDRSSGGGPVSLGQALSAAVAGSEAASRTVVPPTPSVSLDPTAAPVFGQILAELLAHATAATAPGERLEIHTRWGPDGGLLLELLSPRPVPTRTPVEDLDRMLAAGRPDGPVAPQEIGLYLAARLARALGGRLGLRGSPGVASAPGPSPVAVLQLPPSVLAGSSRSAGEDGDARVGTSAGADAARDRGRCGPARVTGRCGPARVTGRCGPARYPERCARRGTRRRRSCGGADRCRPVGSGGVLDAAGDRPGTVRPAVAAGPAHRGRVDRASVQRRARERARGGRPDGRRRAVDRRAGSRLVR